MLPGAGAGRGAAAGGAPAGGRGPRAVAERNPDARPWIRTATWQVPVRWFVLFADEEREYDQAGADEARRRCCATGRRWCRRGAGWPGR